MLPLGVGRELAQSLAAAGIASLRYDKRGVGASGGSYLATGFADNVDDARVAVGSLAAQPECAGVPIFVIGHSEGAMIATALAAEPGTVLAARSGTAPAGGPASHWRAPYYWPARRRPASRPSSGRQHRSRRPCRSRSR